MDILTEDQHRALAFIVACNRQGYSPSAQQVNTWLRNPAGSMYMTMSLVAMAAQIGYDVPSQLVELKWATNHGGQLDVTALGDVLLADAEEKTAVEATATVVALDAEDPLAYATLMGVLASAGKGMLVDPYARRDQVVHLASETSIERLLVGPGLSEKDLAGIRAVLGFTAGKADLQVRQSSNAHDRYLVDDEGAVFMIGSSMNTVASARSSTVVMPVPDGAREFLRERLQSDWDAAEPVRAPEPPAEPPEPAEQADPA